MEFIPLTYYTDYISAHIAQGKLQEEGINCWLKDENSVTLNPILSVALGDIKLMVAESQVERAKELLAEMDKEKRSRFVCPKCESGNIELINSIRKPKNLLHVLASLLFLRYPLTTKVYHCFHCSAEFDDPVEKSPSGFME